MDEIIMVIMGLSCTSFAVDYLNCPSGGADLVVLQLRHEREAKPHVLGRLWEGLTYVFRRNDLGQYLLVDWLWMETEDLVLYQATYHRLYYEARTWKRTYGRIISLIDKSLADIDQLGTAISGWLQDSTAGRLTAGSQQTIRSACKTEVPVFLTPVNPP